MMSRTMVSLTVRLLSLFLAAACCFPCGREAFADTQQITYLENSDNELTIYFITGREPGNTMMIIGGIQGDEPGGYLSADLYADMLLEKGNLIVVPRANFNSIRLNQRGPNGDMNRRFNQQGKSAEDMDQRIVEILKSLILQSDVLLNLHEGSGFYNPAYVSASRNPNMYGQSIIADATRYTGADGRVIELEEPAKRVIDKVNANIKTADHHFHFNNHDTVSDKSSHLEQRKSATYFSLTQAGIPAFGIETSKTISSVSTKVKYETLIINAFMTEYGIIPEHPSVALPEPELDYVVVQIVGENRRFAVQNGETLTVPKGSMVHFTDVVANYQRGLLLDVIGFGDTNDLGQVVAVDRRINVNVYKDSFVCGKVSIAFDAAAPPSVTGPVESIPPESNGSDCVAFSINGKNTVVSFGDTLHIVRGDSLIITGARANPLSEDSFRVNLVGYVGNRVENDAEDRGYSIDTARDLLDRFSLNGGSAYQVDVERISTNTRIGSVFIELSEPRVEYLIVERANGEKLALTPGSAVPFEKDEQVTVLALVTNITAPPFIEMFMSELNRGESKLSLPQVLQFSTDKVIRFKRSGADCGSISFGTRG